MRYMIHFEMTPAHGQKAEAALGGPMSLMEHMMERLKPETIYVGPNRRQVWMVADLDLEAMAEAMVVLTDFSGQYPTFDPVMTREEYPHIAGRAIAAAKKAPKH